MQTSAISLRVADFLRQHPPFDVLPHDDLLMLAQRGRVKFHEADEFVYWQNAKPNPLVYVVQRGAVSLMEEHDGLEQLRDLLGAGDIFGVDSFLGADSYGTSARTNCDVVLYAFHRSDFGLLMERHPHIGRFLEAHAVQACAKPGSDGVQAATGPHSPSLSDVLPPCRPLTCDEKTSLAEAGAILREAGGDALALLDGRGRPVAVLDIRTASASRATHQACGTIACSHPMLFDPATPAHEALLALATSPHPAAILTADGSPESEVVGTVTARELTALLAGHPFTYLERIHAAPDHSTLHWLHRRARQAMLQQLTCSASIGWIAEFSHLLDRAILQRVISLAGLDSAPACWCFFDASGRREALTAAAPSLALISDDPSAARAIAQVLRAFSECGYHGEASYSEGTLAQWQSRFAQLISDPVTHQIELARGLFDLTPAAGDPGPWQLLSSHVSAQIGAQNHFAPLLANDALSNLPPLTFFEDAVVDEAGQRSTHFELGRTALMPLVDLARVYGVLAGKVLGFSTLERLRLGGAGAAAENALRSLLFYQARSGLRHRSTGLTLAPAELGRLDRVTLKSAFRAIGQCLQAVERRAWRGDA